MNKIRKFLLSVTLTRVSSMSPKSKNLHRFFRGKHNALFKKAYKIISKQQK